MSARPSGRMGLLAGLVVALAASGQEPKLDTLPPPKLDTKPLGKPPALGQPVAPGTPIGEARSQAALGLPDVLASVDQHFPLVRAAEQERVIAAGNEVAALGAFDHVLKSQNYSTSGTYSNQRFSTFVEQQTPWHGLSYFAGYRLGVGNFPIYYFDRKTLDGGEFRAGINLPLLRGREIDPFRANLAKAGIDRALAEPSIQLQRLDITRAAVSAFLTWVASGQRLLIARDILRTARDRDAGLAKRVRAGNLAEIEREDNRRVIIEREARLITFQRAFEQASIQLSLYLRDPAGCPVIPLMAQLPAFVEPTAPPDEATRQRDLEEAMVRRPEVQRVELQRRKVQVDLDLAENQLLPALNLGLVGAQDLGPSEKDVARSVGEAALLFDVPLQRRNARGRILALRAEMARLMEQERFARDRVQVEVQNALNGLDRAYDLLRRGRDNRRQNAYLEQAERVQFDVGKSDLFRVNIRELQAVEARGLEIDAAAEFYRAFADYMAALGIDLSRPGGAAPKQGHGHH